MSNIIDLSKLPISDGKQVINIIGLNDNGNIIRAENDTYSKSEIDEKVANVKVDLTGYATEQWVKNQGYVTDGDVNDYVGNEIGQVEEKFNDYYTKTEVDGIVANVGGGSGKDEIIVGLTTSGNHYKIKTDDVQEAYSFNKPLFYSFGGSADAAMLIPLSIKFNMVKTDDGLEHTSYYVWGYLNDGRKLEWTVYPEVEQTEGTIVPAEGGDSGVYILEDKEAVLEYKFTENESGERVFEYETEIPYEGSERQAKNFELFNAIKDGRCKAVVYKKYMRNEEVLISSENGVNTVVSKPLYAYFPCQFTVKNDEWNWTADKIAEFQYVDGSSATSSQDEMMCSLAFKLADASYIDGKEYRIIPDFFCDLFVYPEYNYFIGGWEINQLFNNRGRNLRIQIVTYDGETGQEILEVLPANYFYNSKTGEGRISAINKNNEMMVWHKPSNEYTDTEILPTITPLGGGGSGDSYTKAEIDGMIGDINNILTSI